MKLGEKDMKTNVERRSFKSLMSMRETCHQKKNKVHRSLKCKYHYTLCLYISIYMYMVPIGIWSNQNKKSVLIVYRHLFLKKINI